jgi:CRISPR-associated endonuclease/helicase Cas3
MKRPGLVIIEAPMGEGKTEAAVYLADCWAARLGQRGCYFALPTQATSNQMFSRVREFLACRYPESQINLMLLHGHASLSAEFGALKENYKRLVAFEGIGTDEKNTSTESSGNVLAAEWFTHRKRGLLAPFGVGTIDQILLSVLQTKHAFVRLFGLSHKTVIVDEVHAYDAYMITLLERLLEWLGALRCSVVLLSATLPKERTAALMASYAKGARIESGTWEALLDGKPYPRVTWLSNGTRGARTVETSPRSAKNLLIEWVDGGLPASEGEPFELGKRLKEALNGGGCAAVVCSTVDRAQRVYQALKPYFPVIDAGDGNPELDLLHARYLFKDREAREKRALLRFGKPDGMVDCGEDGLKPVVRPHRAVLVSTQIIEQSLDLDFDIMVTDMAPIDLLIQRGGRIHRHMRETRPEKLEKPKLWVCRPVNDDWEAPSFDKGTETIYGGDWKYILLLSWFALRDLQEFKIPDDVEGAIQFVYGGSPQKNHYLSNAGKEIQTAKEKLANKIDEYAYMAMNNRILGPDDESLLEDFNRGLEEDNPEIHETLRALTRPNELPSLDCIFLFQKDGEHFFDPACSLPAEEDLESGNFNPANFLRNSVKLSHRALVPKLLEKGEKPSCWNKNPLLRHHRLISLDARELTVDFAGYQVRLDPDLGVLIEKRKEDG